MKADAMDVKLFDYTGAGTENPSIYAASKLIYTKKTRLQREHESEDILHEIRRMSNHALVRELDYIARTVPSSWEFITYGFAIRGVTRAFTHQLVRTRTASYAQEAMRISVAEDFEYLLPKRVHDDPTQRQQFTLAMGDINDSYKDLIEAGAKPEDARGILPTNVLTSICMHANLRVVVYLARVRSSPRVQGEYRRFVKKMVKCVEVVHPWTSYFFRDTQNIMDEIKVSMEKHVEDESERLRIYKLIDEVKNV